MPDSIAHMDGTQPALGRCTAPQERRSARRFYFFLGVAFSMSSTRRPRGVFSLSQSGYLTNETRTWRQALTELLSLLGVVEREGVEVARAPDLELGLELRARDTRGDLLYPRLCRQQTQALRWHATQSQATVSVLFTVDKERYAPVASLRVAISMNSLMSRISLG